MSTTVHMWMNVRKLTHIQIPQTPQYLSLSVMQNIKHPNQ